MKRKVKITLTLLSMVLLFSCDYETYVINTVHKDGSVTRKVIMKNSEEKFEPLVSFLWCTKASIHAPDR